ncbi:MAG: CNNM domain-containing protein [Verrucomicrobiota bacterium]
MIAAIPISTDAAGEGSVTALIVFLLVALLVSSFCSLAEAALLSVSDARVKFLLKKKRAGSKRLAAARDHMGRPLASILTLNTIAHTAGTAGVATQATLIFGEAWVFVVSTVVTILILVISEIIPKTLGARFANSLAAPMAILVSWLTVVLTPIIFVLEIISGIIDKIPRGAGENDGSAADVAAAQVDVALDQGHVDSWQGQLMHNVIRLNEITAREIMTPRTVVFSLPATTSIKEFMKNHLDNQFTRVPLYEGSDPADLIGYVLRSDLLTAPDKKAPLKSLVRKFDTFFDRTRASELFRSLGSKRVPIAMLVNEHGILSGIVTMEDIVEEMLGHEIIDERDTVTDMRAHALEKADNGDGDPEEEKASAKKTEALKQG